jgi:hypothetical protein
MYDNPKNDLNLGKILINQMVHYLLIKMTNQIVSYSTYQKKLLIMLMGLNQLVHIEKVVFLRLIILCIFWLNFW